MTVINLIGSTHDLITSQGYRLIDDAWNDQGRRTYIHDDDVGRSHVTSLTVVLKSAGWKNHPDQLWSFIHRDLDEIIEIEPGGPDTSGHLLHHMKRFL